MVLVNEKKFACESCIKGHRSSSCNHTDRPLLEVRKKGRPVSQCDKCRQLRNMRKKHSKCTCDNTDFYDIDGSQPQQPQASTSGTKPRFVPIAPAPPVGSRPRSCFCGNPQGCTCVSRPPIRPLSIPDNQKGKEPSSSRNRLATLARAAAMLSSSSDQQYHPTHNQVAGRTTTSLTLPYAVNDRIKVAAPPTPTLDLPPIALPSGSSACMSTGFPIMPPIARLLSISGSGCTCGFQCTCPGCPEHRSPENMPKGRGYICGDCVDHAGGVELPLSSHAGGASHSTVDEFFARGATFPLLSQSPSARHDRGDQLHSAATISSREEREHNGNTRTSLDDQARNGCRIHGKQGDASQEQEIPTADDRDVKAVRPLQHRSCCGHKFPS